VAAAADEHQAEAADVDHQGLIADSADPEQHAAHRLPGAITVGPAVTAASARGWRIGART
jgi:hypothetical protein